jgi:hypothetical protein
MNWILNLIGIAVYFLTRLGNRKHKNKLSIRFWAEDNWIELLTILLFDIGCMLIITRPEAQINLSEFIAKYIPWLVAGEGIAKLIMSFGLGLGLAALFYSMFRSKIKGKK